MNDRPEFTRDDLRRLLDEHPKLSHHGYPGTVHRSFLRPGETLAGRLEQDRVGLAGAVEAVNAAAAWIARNFEPATRKPRGAPSTYGWKHTMEDETGRYVSNGEFIAACLLSGVQLRIDRSSPNPIPVVRRR